MSNEEIQAILDEKPLPDLFTCRCCGGSFYENEFEDGASDSGEQVCGWCSMHPEDYPCR